MHSRSVTGQRSPVSGKLHVLHTGSIRCWDLRVVDACVTWMQTPGVPHMTTIGRSCRDSGHGVARERHVDWGHRMCKAMGDS
jgi:hypothetical protein